MIQKFKKFGILMCAPLLIMPFIATADQSEGIDYQKDYLEMKSVEDMYLTYHSRMNDMFNKAIKKAVKDAGKVDVSADDIEQAEACTDPENIAAFCLGERALYEYRGYEEAMLEAKESTTIPLFNDTRKAETFDEAFHQVGVKSSFIDREIDPKNGRAIIAQQDTLAFYSEFLGAMQMHFDNTELINSLAAYNEKLSEVRDETYHLAPQFHNVTTDGGGCT